MMTKKQAITILIDEPCPMTPREAAEALDRAGAFPSEATLAEIAETAREILTFEKRAERAGRNPAGGSSRDYALRLASACRAAGLVK